MALIIEDRVMETSTTTGTGDITLAAAVTGFRRFSAVCSTSDTVYYLIEAVDANGVPTGDWETGLGTYSAANTLTRTTVDRSSNSNAAVSFAAGTKRVSLSLTRKGLKDSRKYVFGLVIDGNGSTITTGFKCYSERIPQAHTITKVTVLSIDSAGPATSCSITVDVWADTYANFPPTAADKISASAPATLSSATKSEDSTLTGWTTSIPADSVYGFSVASVTGAKKVLVQIEATY